MLRRRSPQQLRINLSYSHSPKKVPLMLPKIKSNHSSAFYDQLIVSPSYVHIPTTSSRYSLNRTSQVASQILSRKSSSRVPEETVIRQYLEEDRVVQKYTEDNEKYAKLIDRIKSKMARRNKRAQKESFFQIYDKFIGLL